MTKLDVGNNDSGKYKVEVIRNSKVYARKSKGHLLELYYLVSWKGYSDEENTWEPASAVQYLKKLISWFHNDHPDKLITTSPTIDIAPPMARPIVKPIESS